MNEFHDQFFFLTLKFVFYFHLKTFAVPNTRRICCSVFTDQEFHCCNAFLLLDCFKSKDLANNIFFFTGSRFILHIPSEERDNAIRVCFQIELAHWFYLDFYMQNTPGLPQCGIRDFAKADILFIGVIVFCLTA